MFYTILLICKRWILLTQMISCQLVVNHMKSCKCTEYFSDLEIRNLSKRASLINNLTLMKQHIFEYIHFELGLITSAFKLITVLKLNFFPYYRSLFSRDITVDYFSFLTLCVLYDCQKPKGRKWKICAISA